MATTQVISEEQRSHEDLQAENAALKQVLELSLREVERNQEIIVEENKELTEENRELKRRMEEKQKLLEKSYLERKLLVEKINVVVGGVSKANQIIAGLAGEVNGSFSLNDLEGNKCQAIPPVSSKAGDITGSIMASAPEKIATLAVAPSINNLSTDALSQRVPEPTTPKSNPPEFQKAVPIPERKHAVDESRNNFCTCGKSFSLTWKLTKHVDHYSKAHHNFQCTANNCGKKFLNACYLRIHMKRQHNLVYSGRNGCRKCGRTFSTQMLLFLHQKNMHQSGPLLASSSKRLTSTNEPQPSISIVDEKKGNAGSVTSDTMKKAPSVVHGKDMSKADSSGKTKSCLCGRQYPSWKQLYIHVHHFNSDFNFPCNSCGKRFRGIGILRQHMKSKHKLEYVSGVGCRKCGQVFQNRKAIVKHQMKIHLMKPFSVAGGGKNDIVAGTVLATVQQIWDGTTEAPSQQVHATSSTPNVDIQYRQASLFELMSKTPTSKSRPEPGHLAERKHAVDENRKNRCICGKRYAQNWMVVRHVDYFSKSQHKFQCTVQNCGEKFFNTCYLRMHMKREHNLVYSGRNGCRKCGRTFSTTLLLYLHQKNVHNCGPLLHASNAQVENPVTPGMVESVPTTNRSSIKEMGGVVEPRKWQRQKGVQHGKDFSKANAQGQTCFCLCGMKFSSKTNLYYHVNYHATTSNFPCAICGKRFLGTYHWRRHMTTKHRMEYSEGMIGCRKCGLAFGTRKALLEHQRKAHVNGSGSSTPTGLLVDESKNTLSELETPTISDQEWNIA